MFKLIVFFFVSPIALAEVPTPTESTPESTKPQNDRDSDVFSVRVNCSGEEVNIPVRRKRASNLVFCTILQQSRSRFKETAYITSSIVCSFTWMMTWIILGQTYIEHTFEWPNSSTNSIEENEVLFSLNPGLDVNRMCSLRAQSCPLINKNYNLTAWITRKSLYNK